MSVATLKDKWGDHTATSVPFLAAKGQSHWLCPAPHCHSPAVGNVCKASLLPLWHSGCSDDSIMRLLSLGGGQSVVLPECYFNWVKWFLVIGVFLKLGEKKESWRHCEAPALWRAWRTHNRLTRSLWRGWPPAQLIRKLRWSSVVVLLIFFFNPFAIQTKATSSLNNIATGI